jgi:hypothetical protein
MSKEMKLIMESWKGFINEEFDACNTPFTIGDFAGSLELMALVKDEEANRERIEELGEKPRWAAFKKLGSVLLSLGVKETAELAGSELGTVAAGEAGAAAGGTLGAAAGGFLGGPPGAALGLVIGRKIGEKGAAAIGSAIASMFLNASKKEDSMGSKAEEFLSTFCVDSETLDLIEDKYQAQYIKESDIIEELKRYLTNAPTDKPLPDITQHLIDWLNTKSDYKQSDHTTMVAKN